LFTLFWTAFGMGMTFCAPPGTVFAESLRRGVVRGYSAALKVQLGSLIGDAVWAALGLAGAGLLFQVVAVRSFMGVAGVGLLLWLGLRGLIGKGRGQTLDPPVTGTQRDFAIGVALSLTNPVAIAYWVALGGTIQGLVGHAPEPIDFAVFFIAFMSACLAYCFIVAGLIASGRQLLTRRFYRVIDVTCGAALLAFAALLARDTWRVMN
jgi:chemosensory pili system protein ChpE